MQAQQTIIKNADNRLIQVAVAHLNDNPELADKLTDIAKNNNYKKIKEVASQLNKQELAIVYPIYTACI